MKKNAKYDDVVKKLSVVLEKSGATNEEAYIILAMLQHRLMQQAMQQVGFL